MFAFRSTDCLTNTNSCHILHVLLVLHLWMCQGSMIVKYLLVRVFRPSRGEPVLICILLLLKHGTRLCAVRFKSALLKLLIVNVYELVMVLFRRKIVSSWHVLRVLVVNVRITILYCVVILPLTCGYTLTCSMSYSPKAFTYLAYWKNLQCSCCSIRYSYYLPRNNQL